TALRSDFGTLAGKALTLTMLTSKDNRHHSLCVPRNALGAGHGNAGREGLGLGAEGKYYATPEDAHESFARRFRWSTLDFLGEIVGRSVFAGSSLRMLAKTRLGSANCTNASMGSTLISGLSR